MSELAPLDLVDLPAGRWTLVPPRLEHSAEVLAMFSDSDVQQWNPAPKVVDLDSARDWLERSLAWGPEWAVWSIVDDRGRFVGTCVLWNMDRADHLTGSVGYRVAPQARGQGVATAAVRAMSGYAFDTVGLARLELVHTLANVASCVVAERAGYVLEGTLRSEYRTNDGRRWDCHVHSQLSTDAR